MAASNITNEIIITAMDRFVWFVLLVVMSHLVTEFTRVTGYARGNRHDVILINDTLTQPMPVASMIFYPGQEYGLYESTGGYYAGSNGNNNHNNHNNNNNNNLQSNSPVLAGPANGESNSGFGFSFRPLIDSIFEIPISTLRAVNNLVARLTGSYQHQTPTGPLKSTDAAEMLRSLQTPASDADSNTLTESAKTTTTQTGRTLTVRKPTLSEVSE